MKSIFFGLIFFFALHNTFAQGLDYQATGSFQSYPLGTMLSGTVGYGQELWRKNDGDLSQFTYGYVRPYVQLDTVGIINRPYVGVEIYPISLLGFSAGQGFSQRNTQSFTDFDCKAVICDQTLRSQFVEAHLMLGYGDVLLDLTGRKEWFNEREGLRPFYEEMSYLVAAPGSDELQSLTAILGFKYSENINVGLMGIFQKFQESGNDNGSLHALVNYSHGDFRYSAGLGQYRSSHQESNTSAVLRVQWIGLKSLALF